MYMTYEKYIITVSKPLAQLSNQEGKETKIYNYFTFENLKIFIFIFNVTYIRIYCAIQIVASNCRVI